MNSTDFDFNGMKSTMLTLQAQMSKQPNRFVMTTATLQKVKSAISKQEDSVGNVVIGSGLVFQGIPIEHYATVKECMDRMESANDGERLQLVLTEDVPEDCMRHPYMQKQMTALGNLYGFNIDQSISLR